MKATLEKAKLVEVLEKVVEVATKGIASEFEGKDFVTVNVEANKMTFRTTNGAMALITKIDVAGAEPGVFTVCASIFMKIVKGLLSANVLVEEESKGNSSMLVVRDPDKKKKAAKMEIRKDHLDFNIKPKGRVYEFDAAMMLESIHTIMPFVSSKGYRIEYQMVLFHMLPNEMRYVCGDGGCFAIRSYTPDFKNELVNPEGDQYLIPANQLSIVCSLFANAKDRIKVTFKDHDQAYFESSTGDQLHLKGIPEQGYIKYDAHAFRHQEAKAIVDLTAANLVEGVNLVGAVRDKESETDQKFHSFSFTGEPGRVNLEPGNLNMNVNEGRYQCDIDVPADYYNIKNTPVFRSHYHHDFLERIAKALTAQVLRFYCIEEDGIVIVEAVDLDGNAKNEHGVPKRLNEDVPPDARLRWFFAACGEEE